MARFQKLLEIVLLFFFLIEAWVPHTSDVAVCHKWNRKSYPAWFQWPMLQVWLRRLGKIIVTTVVNFNTVFIYCATAFEMEGTPNVSEKVGSTEMMRAFQWAWHLKSLLPHKWIFLYHQSERCDLADRYKRAGFDSGDEKGNDHNACVVLSDHANQDHCREFAVHSIQNTAIWLIKNPWCLRCWQWLQWPWRIQSSREDKNTEKSCDWAYLGSDTRHSAEPRDDKIDHEASFKTHYNLMWSNPSFDSICGPSAVLQNFWLFHSNQLHPDHNVSIAPSHFCHLCDDSDHMIDIIYAHSWKMHVIEQQII